MRMIDSRQLIMAASIFGLAFSGISGSTWGANTTLSTKTVTVDCDAAQGPQSLQGELDKAVPGLTILVSGTCSEPNERYIIRTDNVTIDGQGTRIFGGVVTGGAILEGRITVRGNNVKIRNLALRGVVGATSSGIVVNFGASATIQGSIIEDAGNHGINVNQGAYAQIGSDRRKHKEVGELGSQGNLIQNNKSNGISIRLGGAADVAHNVITGNGNVITGRGDGISSGQGGMADIAANVITSNIKRGISVNSGGIVATDDSGHNGEVNLIENNSEGIRCGSGGIVRGDSPDFGVGNPGTGASPHGKDFIDGDGSCFVDLD